MHFYLKIKRLTFFTIYDEEEPVQIKDGKGMCGTFCAGASLSESEEEEDVNRKNEKIVKNVTFEFEDKNSSLRSSIDSTSPSTLKKAFFWICGIESTLNQNEDPDEAFKNKIDTSIDQDKFYARLCNINAVFAVALCGFCIAFFNKFN